MIVDFLLLDKKNIIFSYFIGQLELQSALTDKNYEGDTTFINIILIMIVDASDHVIFGPA